MYLVDTPRGSMALERRRSSGSLGIPRRCPFAVDLHGLSGYPFSRMAGVGPQPASSSGRASSALTIAALESGMLAIAHLWDRYVVWLVHDRRRRAVA